jgi:DNA repair exonuclease SbcCD ATPase subunit
MEKLGEIAIDNSLIVNLNAQVDQTLLAKNFVTIVDALRELQKAQALSEQKINDLSSLKDAFNQLNEKVGKIENNNSQQSKEAVPVPSSANGDSEQMSSKLTALAKRVEKNESNIMDSIKDINLLNSELRDAKNDIEELKKKLNLFGSSSA